MDKNNKFEVYDATHKAYKLRPIQYPVDIYVVLEETNAFSVKHGSKSNTLYKPKIDIEYVDDIAGYSEQMFIDGFFSCVVTIGVYSEYYKNCPNTDNEIKGTVVHEVQHVIGNIYNRIEQQYGGNEHDAYLACYLYNTINDIIEYDTSLGD